MDKLHNFIHIPHLVEPLTGLLGLFVGMTTSKKARRKEEDKPVLGENVPHTLMEFRNTTYEI